MMFQKVKYWGGFGYWVYLISYKIYRFLRYNRQGDLEYLKKHFYKMQGYPLNFDNPQTLNEKIQWLKVYNRKKFHTQLADKFAVRDFIEKELGEQYLIPIVFATTRYKDLKLSNMPNYPFIIKTNHDSGSYLIIKDLKKADLRKAQVDFRFAMSNNYYWIEREFQYRDIKPQIIVEKLLLNKEGKIPSDYKLHVFSGKVEFIYVSIDREGLNKRNIYNKEWEPLYFTWANKNKNTAMLRGEEICRPNTLDEMIILAEKIGKIFPYVRVDFYDLEGKVYFGEITQHHGGGFDQIHPREMDLFYGKLIDLSSLNGGN